MLCNRRKNDQQDYLDQIWGRKVYLLTLKAEEFFFYHICNSRNFEI